MTEYRPKCRTPKKVTALCSSCGWTRLAGSQPLPSGKGKRVKALNYPLSTYALKTFGTVVDAMLNCSDKSLAYVVITDGGIVGAGEILRAIAPEHLRLEGEFVICNLSESEWHALPSLEDDHWPTATPLPAHAT